MKKRSLGLDRQLSSIPMHNAHVTQGESAPGEIPVLEVELRYSRLTNLFDRLLRWRLRRVRRIQLDPVGWGVYERIDGRKTFEQLVDEFAAEHQLEFLESRSLLMAHIQNLMKAGLVVVGIKPESARGRAGSGA